MKKTIKTAVVSAIATFVLLSLTLVPASGRTHKQASQRKKDVVYVCACMGNRSCPCMSEAKTEGPCACGTQGGPPMKKVHADSAWAKQNRDALAK